MREMYCYFLKKRLNFIFNTHYGCRGWTAHHNADIWRQSAPVGDYGHGDPIWVFWPLGGVWLSQHLWEHFNFRKNQSYLRETAYPIMKEAALFCLDWLIDDGKGIWLLLHLLRPSTNLSRQRENWLQLAWRRQWTCS